MYDSRGISKSVCTGCAACANVCTMNAIQMTVDKHGFKRPVIDMKTCVNCGACSKTCESKNLRSKEFLDRSRVYAMQSKNMETRMRSTSGGLFSELAECVLKRNGCVVGAAYRPNWSVEHRMIWNLEDLESLRRSKYQQSDIGLSYREVKAALDKRQDVFFCGTPCQIGGLKAFLGMEYDNLITCDFICRGVTSPKIFSEYVEALKSIYGADIEYVWMKNKRNGWHNLTTVISFKNEQIYVKNGFDDSYVQLYLKYNMGVRESCYQCQFKGKNDVADVTLGDFWGLEGTVLDDDLGTSVAICRTEKGRKIIDEIKNRVVYQKKEIKDVEMGNPCLNHSIQKSNLDVNQFYDILEREGYGRAIAWVMESDR